MVSFLKYNKKDFEHGYCLLLVKISSLEERNSHNFIFHPIFFNLEFSLKRLFSLLFWDIVITSSQMGNNTSPESQHAQKGFFFQHFRAGSSKENTCTAMWPSFELIWYFVSVLVICKLYKDPI